MKRVLRMFGGAIAASMMANGVLAANFNKEVSVCGVEGVQAPAQTMYIPSEAMKAEFEEVFSLRNVSNHIKTMEVKSDKNIKFTNRRKKSDPRFAAMLKKQRKAYDKVFVSNIRSAYNTSMTIHHDIVKHQNLDRRFNILLKLKKGVFNKVGTDYIANGLKPVAIFNRMDLSEKGTESKCGETRLVYWHETEDLAVNFEFGNVTNCQTLSKVWNEVIPNAASEADVLAMLKDMMYGSEEVSGNLLKNQPKYHKDSKRKWIYSVNGTGNEDPDNLSYAILHPRNIGGGAGQVRTRAQNMGKDNKMKNVIDFREFRATVGKPYNGSTPKLTLDRSSMIGTFWRKQDLHHNTKKWGFVAARICGRRGGRDCHHAPNTNQGTPAMLGLTRNAALTNLILTHDPVANHYRQNGIKFIQDSLVEADENVDEFWKRYNTFSDSYKTLGDFERQGEKQFAGFGAATHRQRMGNYQQLSTEKPLYDSSRGFSKWIDKENPADANRTISEQDVLAIDTMSCVGCHGSSSGKVLARDANGNETLKFPELTSDVGKMLAHIDRNGDMSCFMKEVLPEREDYISTFFDQGASSSY